jgi:hypothetical protein
MRRSVIISPAVRQRIETLKCYLIDELKMSEEAAIRRIDKMENFVFTTLSAPGDFALCRFKRWQTLGYRCVAFDKNWVFAYEVIDGGVIVRDMSHAAQLAE